MALQQLQPQATGESFRLLEVDKARALCGWLPLGAALLRSARVIVAIAHEADLQLGVLDVRCDAAARYWE